MLAPGGTIIVTLFEGEPYSLWNIRDLARHVGLQVGRSFQFQADAYPEYVHARTLGNIEGGGGWKGADREARTFILQLKDEEQAPKRQHGAKRKKAEMSDSEDDG